MSNEVTPLNHALFHIDQANRLFRGTRLSSEEWAWAKDSLDRLQQTLYATQEPVQADKH